MAARRRGGAWLDEPYGPSRGEWLSGVVILLTTSPHQLGDRTRIYGLLFALAPPALEQCAAPDPYRPDIMCAGQ